MILFRYLTKEIVMTLLGVTFVLLLLFLSNELVRFLSYAASGKLVASIILQLIGFQIPYLLALLLPLGLYLGIILAYGRLYADNEIRVMHACGLSVRKLIFMTAGVSLLVTFTVLILTLWVNPWLADQKEQLIVRSLTTDNLLDNLMPGRFQVLNDGARVIYVERISQKHKEATNVFFANQAKDKNWSIVSSNHGSQMIDPTNHNRFMVAEEGYHYDGVPGRNDFKIIHFKKYAVRVPRDMTVSKHQVQESMLTSDLWKNHCTAENAAELQWRLSIPLSTFILSLFAIPFSQTRPRSGRYSQLFPAILIYIIYVNGLFMARAWVEQKLIPPSLGLWWVHGLAFMCVVILLLRSNGLSIKKFLRFST